MEWVLDCTTASLVHSVEPHPSEALLVVWEWAVGCGYLIPTRGGLFWEAWWGGRKNDLVDWPRFALL